MSAPLKVRCVYVQDRATAPAECSPTPCDAYLLYTSAPQNALDWASKPFGDGPPPMQGRGVALCGAGGGAGTMRSQLALRQTAVFMQLNVITQPEVRCVRWCLPHWRARVSAASAPLFTLLCVCRWRRLRACAAPSGAGASVGRRRVR